MDAYFESVLVWSVKIFHAAINRFHDEALWYKDFSRVKKLNRKKQQLLPKGNWIKTQNQVMQKFDPLLSPNASHPISLCLFCMEITSQVYFSNGR